MGFCAVVTNGQSLTSRESQCTTAEVGRDACGWNVIIYGHRFAETVTIKSEILAVLLQSVARLADLAAAAAGLCWKYMHYAAGLSKQAQNAFELVFCLFVFTNTKKWGDAISSLSPCVKLSPALHVTAVKLRVKTPPGGETSSTEPLGCWNKMSQWKNDGWPKERHKVCACWAWFVFPTWAWFGRILLWAEGFCLLLPDTSLGNVEVYSLVGGRPGFIWVSGSDSIFTDAFFLNFVLLASSQQCDQFLVWMAVPKHCTDV